MTGRGVRHRRFAEECGGGDSQDSGQSVQERGRRGLETSLDLRQIVLGHASQGRDLLARYSRLLAAAYQTRQAELSTRGRALPGAAAAIAALAQADSIVQSVLTGNLRSVAETKLKTFHVDAGLDLDVGAYGSDGAARPDLVPVAQQRAGKKYESGFTTATTVLIGDTPSDIEAAHVGGARIIGVATGKSSAAGLRQAGADAVLENLQDSAAVVSAVTETAQRS